MSERPVAASPSSSIPGTAPLPASGLVLLVLLTIFWGVNWPAMKLALTGIAPFTFRTICLLIGGVCLLGFALAQRQSIRIRAGDWSPLFWASLLNVTGWHLFSAYGLLQVPAGRGAIIAFTMPIWASILASIVLKEAFTGRKIIGLLLGIGGLAVLIGPEMAALGAAPIGSLLMLGAAVSWAAGTIVTKRQPWQLGTAALTGWQLLLGGIPILIGALLIDPVPDFTGLSQPVLWAAIYAAVIPMIFCHWAWFRIVSLFPASIAAIGTLAIPVVGVLSSALILGEAIGPAEIAALVLVLAGLSVVLLRR
ncbi:MAG: DMT family transporter [Alphaproteobacteria bacterium]|nr:DMT family transporter [Alphaproteobacteria bacterium]MBU0799183.1 DMT family transporter [Alphaproteobacteria bacterium]MBU0887974.1 DMT family transporter [Alphaproteobacteria bacterium]MBU1814803.1 DMT family transporter [Alphaproteobacteria bacterium]